MIIEFHPDEFAAKVGDLRPEFANVFGKALEKSYFKTNLRC